MAKEQPLKHNKKKSKSKKVRKEKVDEVDPIGLLRKLTNTAKSKTVCLPHKIFYDLILYYHSMICSVIFFFIFLDFWRSWDVRNPPWCPARKPSESGTLLNFLLQCRYNIIDVLCYHWFRASCDTLDISKCTNWTIEFVYIHV